jgi:hypothetical protein
VNNRLSVPGEDDMPEPFEDVEAFIERAQRGLPALRRLLDEARAELPGRAWSADATGTVRVALGEDGLPEAFAVAANWRSAVGVEGFAAAVTQACHNAVIGVDEPGGTAQVAPSVRHLLSMLEYLGGTGEPPPGIALGRVDPPEEPVAATPAAGPLWTAPLLDELHATARAMAGVDDLVEAARRAPVGSGAHGRLTLTAGEAVTCTADPEWLGRQEAAELEAALASAVSSLRNARHAAEAELDQLLSRPQRLLREMTE